VTTLLLPRDADCLFYRHSYRRIDEIPILVEIPCDHLRLFEKSVTSRPTLRIQGFSEKRSSASVIHDALRALVGELG
jgi:hypothetical protein